MTPLRILQVNSMFSGGGTDNQVIDLSAGLKTLGDDVMLAIPAGCRLEARARETGAQLEFFPTRSWLKNAMIRRLIQLIRAWRPHILHVHQGRDYWPGILAARLAACGTRVVVTRHLMTRPRSVSRWLLLTCSDVVAVSRAVETVLKDELHGPRSRLHQVYGGIDTKVFQPIRSAKAAKFRKQQGWGEQDLVFGVVGAYVLPRGKGQLEFLEAAARLRADFPHARFAIVGDGGLKSVLIERIAALGLSQCAVMVPFTDDVPTVMSALDILVHPALGTEALGLVLWEAMACGKPVIASRLHGIPEAFTEGEHGFLVPPAEVPPLTEAMRRLAADAALRERFGQAGRAYVAAQCSREAAARNVRELYEKILQRSKS